MLRLPRVGGTLLEFIFLPSPNLNMLKKSTKYWKRGSMKNSLALSRVTRTLTWLVSSPAIEDFSSPSIEDFPSPSIEDFSSPSMEDFPSISVEDFPSTSVEDFSSPSVMLKTTSKMIARIFIIFRKSWWTSRSVKWWVVRRVGTCVHFYTCGGSPPIPVIL